MALLITKYKSARPASTHSASRHGQNGTERPPDCASAQFGTREGGGKRLTAQCRWARPMSGLGQTEKYSARADVFRCSSDNGHGFSTRKGRYADRRSLAPTPFVSPIPCYGMEYFPHRRRETETAQPTFKVASAYLCSMIRSEPQKVRRILTTKNRRTSRWIGPFTRNRSGRPTMAPSI
jgi:hypothetical protein